MFMHRTHQHMGIYTLRTVCAAFLSSQTPYLRLQSMCFAIPFHSDPTHIAARHVMEL